MKRLILAAMVVGAMAVASKAEAALAYSYTICQGATCSTFNTNVVSNTTVGDYNIIVASGSGTNGTPTSLLNSNSLSVTRTGSTSSAPLDIWFTVTGYTLPTGPNYLFDVALGVTETSTGGNPSRDAVSYQAWYSSTNGTGTPPAGSSPSNIGSCTPAMSTLSDSCNSNPGALLVSPGSNLFSITSLTRIGISIGNTSTFSTTGQASLTAVPEPGSMVLLGTGLLGIATIARRRLASKK